jgi:hypothetical protein
VQVSFDAAEYTANADAIGTLRLLEAIRILGPEGSVRFHPAKAKRKLGWSHRIGFAQLVAEMMESDLQRMRVRDSAMAPSEPPCRIEGRRIWIAGHRGMVGLKTLAPCGSALSVIHAQRKSCPSGVFTAAAARHRLLCCRSVFRFGADEVA